MGEQGIRVMIVDDDMGVHRLLLQFLRFWDCEQVEAAFDGEEAVQKYKAFCPDVVIMDMEMPRMDGYEASRAILEWDSDARIVLITGDPQSPHARQALSDGLVKAAVSKPFYMDQLQMAIEMAVKKFEGAPGDASFKGAVA